MITNNVRTKKGGRIRLLDYLNTLCLSEEDTENLQATFNKNKGAVSYLGVCTILATVLKQIGMDNSKLLEGAE